MKSQQAHPAHFSIELFPPRTDAGREKLPAVVAELAQLAPAYFSVTFGAGGSTQDGTFETVQMVQRTTGLEAAPHISCIGSTRERIAGLLERYREAGITRLVALRGDLPATAHGTGAPGEFRFANELIEYIRATTGGHFKIEVAAYPEMHPQARNPDVDFANFRRKVEAGANAAITQYFYNAQAYTAFIDRCEAAGLSIPVVPGVMPITNYAQLTRFSDACGAEIPRWVRLKLEQLQDDGDSLQAFGLEVVSRLCEDLLAAGAPGLHFYALNKVEPVTQLWRNLGLPAVPPPGPEADSL